MFDPLLTLIAAKTKAVGLVAGTAMVTTALVGGGAVAMTAVSDSTELAPETAVEQVVESATPTATIGDVEVVTAPVSDSPTVGIDTPKAPRPLPSDFTCKPELNHGQNVSAYAKSLPKGPGRGEKVSAVAQSDCGKKADSTEVEAASVEAEETETETDEVEEPKPAKAEKPAKPTKPAKAAKSKGGGKK